MFQRLEAAPMDFIIKRLSANAVDCAELAHGKCLSDLSDRLHISPPRPADRYSQQHMADDMEAFLERKKPG
jgi:hypothetical protein